MEVDAKGLPFAMWIPHCGSQSPIKYVKVVRMYWKSHVCLLQLRQLVQGMYFQMMQSVSPITVTTLIQYKEVDGLIMAT